MAVAYGAAPTAQAVTADINTWMFVGILLIVSFLAMFLGMLPIIGTIIGIVIVIAAKMLTKISGKVKVLMYVAGAVIFAVSIASLILLGAAAASVPSLPTGVNSVSDLYGLSDSIALRGLSVPMWVYENVANPLLGIEAGETVQSAGIVTFEQATGQFGAVATAAAETTPVAAAVPTYVGY